MSDSPPPIQEKDFSPVRGRFARIAAIFSVLTPFLVIGIYFLLFQYLLSHGRTRMSSMVGVVIFLMLLIFVGLVFGIIALIQTRRHGRKGVFAPALTGVCLNSLFLLGIMALPLLIPLFISKNHPRTPQARLDKALNELNAANSEEKRFYALNDAAKESFNSGKIDEAGNYATQLLDLAPQFQNNWNYGNAIHDGNLVLGRIALRDGGIEKAKQYLLAAGNSKGSPQMDSFGPNMSLAKDLLEKGERDVVLQYFDLCRKFWKMDHSQLDDWSQQVKAGKTPNFGANLVY